MNMGKAQDCDGAGLILPWLDENLERMAKREEEIKVQSKLVINGDPHLKNEVQVLHECLDYFALIFREYQAQTEDEFTVQQVGARIFNSGACGLGLSLTGYYQGSLTFARDLLETGLLLDFFHFAPARIGEWRQASNQERVRNFGPSKIRKALDDVDGFTTRKREERYQQLCEYATHLTYAGLGLIAPNGKVTFGPFFDERLLRCTMEELTAEVVQASLCWNANLTTLPLHCVPDYNHFIEVIENWSRKREAEYSRVNDDV